MTGFERLIQKGLRGAAVAVLIAAGAGCATAEVKPAELKAASEAVNSIDMARMECPELKKERDQLLEKTAKATVKPGAVDLTSAEGVAKAKDLKPGQTAASVAMTTAKSIIPGGGFMPLITGSAGRAAKRTAALNEAKVTLAKLEGVMIAKSCHSDAEAAGETEAAPATESAAEAPASES